MKSFFFNIDTLGIGQCNLRCPSCSVANSDVKNPTGFMAPELLNDILTKATQECHVTGVGLFSWTEPLLHPRLPELINITNSFNIPVSLSSNLNLKKDFKSILEANPASFRISLSGFNQSIYSRFHQGGNIEIVKENMLKLAEAKAEVKSSTPIHVLYHRYLGNIDDEVLMKEFAIKLGFAFVPVWAYYMNLDKILAYFNGDKSALTENDLDIIKQMTLPFWEGTEILKQYKDNPCSLREEAITLDKDGNVLLCCASYDIKKYTITNFLTSSIDDIQAIKSKHNACSTCMDNAYHIYVVHGTSGSPEIDQVSFQNITEYYLEKLGIFMGI
jgi:MoaA/NifB/PqqE/SkfB family radical SAM enzyme